MVNWMNRFENAKVQFETLADNDQVITFSGVVMDQAGLAGG